LSSLTGLTFFRKLQTSKAGFHYVFFYISVVFPALLMFDQR
jgi:hypothetical protein